MKLSKAWEATLGLAGLAVMGIGAVLMLPGVIMLVLGAFLTGMFSVERVPAARGAKLD